MFCKMSKMCQIKNGGLSLFLCNFAPKLKTKLSK